MMTTDMNRISAAVDFWDRSKSLSIHNKEYQQFLQNFFNQQLQHDQSDQDITTQTVVAHGTATAIIMAKEEGIIAGIEEVQHLLLPDFTLILHQQDGRLVNKGDHILTITGNAHTLLSMERTLLNLLQRMSGVATATYRMKQGTNDSCFVMGTRKTLWGLLDKKAISLGGGLTHRLHLKDALLIKDNHLTLQNSSVNAVITKAACLSDPNRIEIEVTDKDQAVGAAKTIVHIKSSHSFALLLDNMTPSELTAIVAALKDQNLISSVLLEASGNITLENIGAYASTGVDALSSGTLTHSAHSLNLSMEMLGK